MNQPIRLCLALHNHQPVGNFDFVFEQAYRDSYLPFLDVFESFADLRISLHTSGPLMDWLLAHHEEYIERLAALVAAGRVEVLGGAYYEPILTMIPAHDRIGQITRYTRWLESRLEADIRGLWIPERVWEQSLTRDLVDSGIQYTILDDFHFKNAGLSDEQLTGYFLTEDEGRLLRVFPGSERLRYLIPFSNASQTIEFLRQFSVDHPGGVIVFGDDGEKFGTWPNTKQHVYENQWLHQFFRLLVENQDWIKTTTLSETVQSTSPAGKIYLPEGSYREMTEWSLPTNRQIEYENLAKDMSDDERWTKLRSFIRGGYWRNFKVKYPESDTMYSRMMMVSRRLDQLARTGADEQLMDAARLELYRGQCNCSYWHGAFGGIYLPHLRNAVFAHLIKADNLLDRADGKTPPWVEADAEDFNFDAHQEIVLSNGYLSAFISPNQGGQIYELDVRSISHNLSATLARREESYHERIRAGRHEDHENVSSIHDRVEFKQEGLEQRLFYDRGSRNSLVDHFFKDDEGGEAVAQGRFTELGDFVQGPYDARIRRNPDRIQVKLFRPGTVDGRAINLTKGVTLDADNSTLEIAYLLEGLPTDRALHFGVEFNFAGLPAGADDRYFYGSDGQHLGQLGHLLDLQETNELGLVDQWLGVDVNLRFDRPSNLWTFPVESVSQSEAGFESVHQCVAVLPHWHVVADSKGRWSVTLRLSINTDQDVSHNGQEEALASTVGRVGAATDA